MSTPRELQLVPPVINLHRSYSELTFHIWLHSWQVSLLICSIKSLRREGILFSLQSIKHVFHCGGHTAVGATLRCSRYPLVVADQDHSSELVCMVSAHEEAGRGQGAAGLSAQASALQPGQCGAERRCGATHQQWQPALHWLPRPGGHALCPNSRLWGRVWSFGLLPNTWWAPHAWYTPLWWGPRPGQDPGGGPLHRQPLPLPGWEWGDLQWVEVCGLCGGPLVPHGLFGFYHHLHHRHPHVSPKLCGGCVQRLCLMLSCRRCTDKKRIWRTRIGVLTLHCDKWKNSEVSL